MNKFEHKDAFMEGLIYELLQAVGEDPEREDLLETPARVRKAWEEFTSGYKMDVKDVFKTFEDSAQNCDEMVIVHNIPIISRCAHHLEPITGIAHIGYIPDGKVVGLSKLARVAEIYMRRLQLQEAMTNQIADAMQENLKPKGIGVLIRASHGCMSNRGVKIHGSVTTTSALRGVVKNEASARAEFLMLCDMAERNK